MRWLRTITLGLGLGLVAGGFESIQIASMLRLEMTFSELVQLGGAAALAGALVAAVVALPVGLAVQLLLKRSIDSRALAAGMAATAFFLSGFYLWNAAGNLLEMQRASAAIAMAACPIGVAGVVWFNAGYWLRREEIGAETRLGWWGVSALLSLALVLISGAMVGSARPGGGRALEGDPNVLILTVDALRRDHVGIYGGGLADTPNMDRLGREGVVFMDAVTPSPDTAPAHASMFTSLHPLRHKVMREGDRLLRGHVTLAERLQDEGYATGAFVSSAKLSVRTGLDQGFTVYDDDFAPAPRGLGQLLLVNYATRGLLGSGNSDALPWLLERQGHRTADIAERWVRQQGERPWFAWVHLNEPHAPYLNGAGEPVAGVEPDSKLTGPELEQLRARYAQEVSRADEQVGRVLDLLEELGQAERTLVVLTADHGELLGEHGLHSHHRGLFDEAVRVPLILRAPGKRFRDMVIPQQVRLMDVAPTALAWVKLDPFEPAEGVELLGYPLGLRKLSLVADLVGQRPEPGGGCLFGLRSVAEMEGQELRAKYIFDPTTDQEWFFDLVQDPAEGTDVGEAQPEAVAVCRARVSAAAASAPCEAGEVLDDPDRMLKALDQGAP